MSQLNRTPSRSGFTIIEMMVTIGILVLVTAGVATIFNTLGDTVSKGRKLSELNQFAARLERVMREDFEAMTRDGFLVIVNKNANDGNDVQLFRGEKTDIDNGLFGGFSDNEGRIRRSDEIMFFRRGDFETARRAISSDMIARSHEAAIYYGHGQKRVPDLATDPNSPANLFFNPQPWDNNYDAALDARLGINTVGQINPNEFARDWSLLRQVTLLVNPRGTGHYVPLELFGLDRNNFGASDRSFLEDSPRQYSLQPAARSIFTSLSGSDASLNHRWIYDDSSDGQPAFAHYRTSGLVDIVTEDIATIRGMLQALPVSVSPTAYFNYTPLEPQPLDGSPVLVDRDDFETNIYWGNPGATPNPSDARSLNLGDAAQQLRVRQWMTDALPSRWNFNGPIPEFVSGVRFEDIPTRVLFEDSAFTLGNDDDDNRRAYAEANQEMLGASVFVPRCSEFIVEWSYGFVDNTLSAGDVGFKELMWYGLDRYVDSDNDGILTAGGGDKRAAKPYTRRTIAQAGADPTVTPIEPRERGMLPQVVVGRVGAPTTPDAIEIATFGYMDANGTPVITDDEPWLWPKLIRITMSLADANDRAAEQTYQIIFELPELE